MKIKKAFTLLELVFVILIIGILVAICVPFLNQNKNDAKLLKLKADYEMLSSALALMRNEFSLKQLPYFSPTLDNAKIALEKEKLFYCEKSEIAACQNGINCCFYSLLSSPLYSNSKAWIKQGLNHYRFFLSSKESVDFIYNANEGILECLNSKWCKELL